MGPVLRQRAPSLQRCMGSPRLWLVAKADNTPVPQVGEQMATLGHITSSIASTFSRKSWRQAVSKKNIV